MLGAAYASAATPNGNGQSGYIAMPSAYVEADGTFSMGYGYNSPYSAMWVTSTILPAVQLTGRYVSISGIPGFEGRQAEQGKGFGRYKDKVIDVKLRLLEEGALMPALALGYTDTFGTGLFKGQYIVASKSFGAAKNVEASIGYGNDRPSGVFAGMRWMPASAPNWALVAEYDANDYQHDFRARETSAGQQRKGPALGLEYRWGWLGARVSRDRDHFAANVFATIPLAYSEFVPKVAEPRPFAPKKAPLRQSIAAWQDDPRLAAPLIQALARQNFKNIRVSLEGGTLRLALTSARISQVGRAVGRAARTALAFAPLETRALHVTYTKLEMPIATYEFQDMTALGDYLNGLGRRDDFLKTVLVRPAASGDVAQSDGAVVIAGLDDKTDMDVQLGRDGELVQLRGEDREANRFKLAPKLGFYFNDPSGALRYDLALQANYDKRLDTGLFLNSSFRASLLETISGVTQPSNSALPHVRSDIAEFKRGGRVKMNRLLINQYMKPADRWYARVSAGFYEEMYRGIGGQLLYAPVDARWAADLSVDALEQRGYKGWLDKRDYRTVTTLGALHYKLPYNVTVTARAGRFLAKDTGVRMEFSRRFRSGVELGAWFTKTNGRDITSPGSAANPYNDKGIFLSIPLRSMLSYDSQSGAAFSLAPWTRDVGQMVASPADLYNVIEQPRRDMHSYDGLGDFGERPDERNLPAVSQPDLPAPNPWPAFRMRLDQAATGSPPVSDLVKGVGLAGGAVLASALLDKKVDNYVVEHGDSRLTRGWNNFGKNMPIALVAFSGTAIALGDDRMANMGVISLQAVAASLGASAVGKYVVQRARPEEDRGASSRVGAGESRVNSSFPSGHAAVAFAAVTPFAQEYDAPWLYGVATLSSMGRVAGRKHWVSDTVAGGLIGYATGSWLWRTQRDNTKSRLTVAPGLKDISVAYQGKF